jgi:hypothetical protein
MIEANEPVFNIFSLTCVMNNGWISEILKNSRRIKDCPLSALLFVLSVEIMALE